MKNSKYLLGGLVLIAFACKKPDPVPPPSPDAAALTIFTSENIGDATQHFTVDANSPIYIVGAKGTVLSLGADALVDSDGNLVTGNVDVELIEINKKSEMAMMNKATNGKKASGELAPLVSLGEFYISMSQSGTEVTLTEPLQVSAIAPTYASQTRKFLNTASDGEDLLWEMTSDSLIAFEEGEDSLFMLFDILPGEWGWANCDYFYDDPRPRTSVTVLLPEGFDATNTRVYISIDGELTLINYYTSAQLPIGLECHFIAAGIVGDELHYSIQDVTLVADHVEDIDGFAAISEDGLTTLIDALP